MSLKIISVAIVSGGLILAGCAPTQNIILTPTPNPTEEEITAPSPETTILSPLTINDQAAINNSIVVDEVALDEPGFIVIHRSRNGQPGAVIGSSPLISSTSDTVQIRLNQNVRSGETLIAMLHTDVNGNGELEFPGPDVPVQNTAGEPVTQEFTIVTATPTL